MGMIAQDPYQPETTWELRQGLRVICCGATIQQGEYVEVIDRPSKNFVRVKRVALGQIHTIKLKSLRRAGRRADG